MNIERIRKAVEEVRKLRLDAAYMRLKLDELLRVWEKKWYLMSCADKREAGDKGARSADSVRVFEEGD